MLNRNFIQDCLAGQSLPESIHDYIDRWHESHADTALPDYLGITGEEYQRWVNNPKVLPWIIAEYSPSPFAQFGPLCGPGWAQLYVPVIQLCAEQQITIINIKEKFGCLRIVTRPTRPPVAIERAIRSAQRESLETCEICGAWGTLRDRGLERRLKTLCEEHRFNATFSVLNEV